MPISVSYFSLYFFRSIPAKTKIHDQQTENDKTRELIRRRLSPSPESKSKNIFEKFFAMPICNICCHILSCMVRPVSPSFSHHFFGRTGFEKLLLLNIVNVAY